MKMVIESISPEGQTQTREWKPFRELYETAFPLVAKFIGARGGSFDDAKDIFHDALVIYREKRTSDVIHIRLSEEAYVVGIAKHLWFRKNKADRKFITLDDAEAAISVPEDYFDAINSDNLLAFLERSGKKCMALLKSFYYDGSSVINIARAFGFKSAHSATVQKFKCLEKMRDEVKQKSISYEDFLE